MNGFRSIHQDDQWFVRRLGNASLQRPDTFWCGDEHGNGAWQLAPGETCFFLTMGEARRVLRGIKERFPDEHMVVSALEDCEAEMLGLVRAAEAQAKQDGLFVGRV